jgi:DNA-binding cell septation regulator SpoVG
MIEGISVVPKLIDKPSNAVKAVCDVTVDFGDEGSVEVSGFRVIERDGKAAWVSPPSRQGRTAWFEVIKLRGQIKSDVEAAILKEYERLKKSQGKK